MEHLFRFSVFLDLNKLMKFQRTSFAWLNVHVFLFVPDEPVLMFQRNVFFPKEQEVNVSIKVHEWFIMP